MKVTLSTPKPVAARPGSKARCRHCRLIIRLLPDHQLEDGTQIYSWQRKEQTVLCAGGRGVTIVHKPNYRTIVQETKAA